MNRKRVLSFLMAALFVLTCAGMASAEVVEIGSAAQLAAFRDGINDGTIDRHTDAKLTKDIDLSELTDDWTPIGWGAPWEPWEEDDDWQVDAVSTLDVPVNRLYEGTFDGDGHTVSGLELTAANAVVVMGDYDFPAKALGFFGVVGKAGVVKNVKLAAPSVDATDGTEDYWYYSGSVAGVLFGSIEDCSVTDGTVIGHCAGGVVGENSGTLANCAVTDIGNIEGFSAGGGVVGYNYNGTVANCTANGIESIESNYAAGGVVGENASTVSSCTVTDIGSIEGVYAGGVAGHNSGTVANCTVSGNENIEGDSAAGGVAGYNSYTVTNCSVSGVESIYGGANAGGVVGVNSDSDAAISNCVVSDIGEIIGDGDCAGGIVGYNFSSAATVTNCLLMGGPTTISGSGSGTEGGVIGFLSGGADSLGSVGNCLYPSSGITFAHGEDKPIGNIPLGTVSLEDLLEEYNIGHYNASLDIEDLPAIMAMIEQGIAVEVQKGKTYTLDVTTLPGTLGFENLTFDWDTDDVSGDVIGFSFEDEVATLEGIELGTATVTCEVRGAISADLSCAVTVVAAKPDDNGGGGSSSNCSAFGFGLLTLAAIPLFVRKRR